MAINRSLMERQLRMGGGIMNAMPRQQYGLGSFVKKAVKGVTGAAKSAVKGITGAIKDNPALALAALNFAPMLAGGSPFVGFGKGKFAGSLFNIPGIAAGVDKFKSMGDIAKTASIFAGGSLLGGVLGQAQEEGDPEGITRNVGALRIKLADAYRNQRTFADAEDEEAAIANKLKEMYLNIQPDLDIVMYNNQVLLLQVVE
jgi:hypothetical protein